MKADAGHGCPRCLRPYRHPGPDRPAHPCLLGRHFAWHRRGRILPDLRRHHRGRYRQRRPRQFRRLPQACDRAEPGPHSRLSACLACRHLRLLEPRHGRRERGIAADGSDQRGRGGGRQPRSHCRHQGSRRPSRVRHVGDRAARDRARGRRTDRHALDVPYRPSAAELRGCGRAAASGRRADPRLPAVSQFRRDRARHGEEGGAGGARTRRAVRHRPWQGLVRVQDRARACSPMAFIPTRSPPTSTRSASTVRPSTR